MRYSSLPWMLHASSIFFFYVNYLAIFGEEYKEWCIMHSFLCQMPALTPVPRFVSGLSWITILLNTSIWWINLCIGGLHHPHACVWYAVFVINYKGSSTQYYKLKKYVGIILRNCTTCQRISSVSSQVLWFVSKKNVFRLDPSLFSLLLSMTGVLSRPKFINVNSSVVPDTLIAITYNRPLVYGWPQSACAKSVRLLLHLRVHS